MKVAELMEILKGANPNADITLQAKFHYDLDRDHIVFTGDGNVEIDCLDFIDEAYEFNEMLGAL